MKLLECGSEHFPHNLRWSLYPFWFKHIVLLHYYLCLLCVCRQLDHFNMAYHKLLVWRLFLGKSLIEISVCMKTYRKFYYPPNITCRWAWECVVALEILMQEYLSCNYNILAHAFVRGGEYNNIILLQHGLISNTSIACTYTCKTWSYF